MDDKNLKKKVLTIIQPLTSSAIGKVKGLTVKLGNIFGFGDREAILSYPFGFVSKPINGVTAYFSNLLGDTLAPVVIAHLHKKRPTPSADGETILYSCNGDGFPTIITLGSDGSLNIKTSKEVFVETPKVNIKSPVVDLGEGTLEKIVNGETFKSLYNSHTHLGNLGAPTGVPQAPMADSELSSIVKGAK